MAKELKSAKEILKRYIETPFRHTKIVDPENAIKAMEEYADQFKYDFSKICVCDDSTGATWCCNQCGLPTPDKSQKS